MGRHVTDSLVPNEHVVHEGNYHWVIFFLPKSIRTLCFSAIIARLTSEFVITNRRIVIKTGWIRVHTVEININQIESIKVEQGLIGRVLGFGTVAIIGSGGTQEVFYYIARPLEFRRAYQRLPLA